MAKLPYIISRLRLSQRGTVHLLLLGCLLVAPSRAKLLGVSTTMLLSTGNCICEEARHVSEAATSLSRIASFKNAVLDIQKAYISNKREYGLALERDSVRKGDRTVPIPGNIHSTSIGNLSGKLGDIHIHTDEKPPSSGDLYGFLDQAIKDSAYLRYILTPGNQLYALGLIDKAAAIQFLTLYPKRNGIRKKQADGTVLYFQPTFPQNMVEEFDQLKGWYNASDEAAICFILEKYNSGVGLFKRNAKGDFKRIYTEIKQNENGNLLYMLRSCL